MPVASPGIRRWVVSPAPVIGASAISAPDDHFTASPDRRVVTADARRVGMPVAVHVSSLQHPRDVRYCGKRIVGDCSAHHFRRLPCQLWSPSGCKVVPPCNCRWLHAVLIVQLRKKRSARAGLARHSAMTNGSHQRLKSSRCTLAALVCWAMRSISACSCSEVIGHCQ